jgi:hypothetical protein
MEIDADVKLKLESAIAEEDTLRFYLDNLGNQETKKIEEQPGETVENLRVRLIESATGNPPTFEVCYVLRGELQHDGGAISMESVPELIDKAVEARTIFYKNRTHLIPGGAKW